MGKEQVKIEEEALSRWKGKGVLVVGGGDFPGRMVSIRLGSN